MKCKLCGHPNAHKHGTLPNGTQRFRCPSCRKTFTDSFDTLYYRRHVTPEQIVLQCPLKVAAYEESRERQGWLTTLWLAS